MAKGFTLVELVLVIILLGVLSVSIAPVLFSRPGFSEYTFRDRLISLLQTIQLQAMNNASECSAVVITAMRFGVPSPCGTMNLPNTFSPDFLGVSTSEAQTANLVINAPVAEIGFNFLGQPIDPQTGNAICASGCTVQITGESTATVRIESEGYIHSL